MDNNFLWWRDGIIYQIYPRSFADSNLDGIGDLNGITARLDYLADLGVDALWLSPINPSPDVDFGYDVSDYLGIDPKFGTLEDFDRLVSEAHQRGIRIVLDLVLNHTSDQHAWFQEARKSRDNPYRDYYIWRDAKPDGKEPNNWQACFGGPAWEWDAQTSQYYLHLFYKEQPDVNWRNPAVRQAMLDVFRFWLKRGVDGFRLDVFNAYFKHPDFPDNPSKFGIRGFDRVEHIYDISQPEMQPLVNEIRAILDEYPQTYAVGETFVGGAEMAADYVGEQKLHAAFDFEFLKCPWRPHLFLKAVQRWEQALPAGAWPNFVLNNHDNPRSATRYAKGESDDRLKVAAALLLTQRGTPFLYYGEEIGMRDIHVSREEIQDPIGKRFWPFFKGRDGCRSPMQWDDSVFAGFSHSQPWLALHPNFNKRNVAAQQSDPNSLLNFYKRLIRVRRKTPALINGMLLPLTHDTHYILAYLRQTDSQTVMVALNFSRTPQRLVLGSELARSDWKLLLSSTRQELPQITNGILELHPNEACILEKV